MADKNPLAVAARPVVPKPRVTARSAPKAAAARVATVEMAGVTVVALPAVPQANPAMPGARALKAASSARKGALTTALMAVVAKARAKVRMDRENEGNFMEMGKMGSLIGRQACKTED